MGHILTHRGVLPVWMYDAMESGGREVMRERRSDERRDYKAAHGYTASGDRRAVDRRDPPRSVAVAVAFEIEVHDHRCEHIRDLNYPPGQGEDVDADAIDAECLRAAGEALVKLRDESA